MTLHSEQQDYSTPMLGLIRYLPEACMVSYFAGKYFGNMQYKRAIDLSKVIFICLRASREYVYSSMHSQFHYATGITHLVIQ